ncbi:MAG: hypothetical protein Q9209_004977 [Squamulea sp. 1 TL-2023]
MRCITALCMHGLRVHDPAGIPPYFSVDQYGSPKPLLSPTMSSPAVASSASPSTAPPTQTDSPNEALRGPTNTLILDTAQGDSSLPRPRSHIAGVGRHTLGIILLSTTVFLWTASQFLASDLFADHTYSKPYFVTYVNSSFFAILLVPVLLQRLLSSNGIRRHLLRQRQKDTKYVLLAEDERNTLVKTVSKDARVADGDYVNDGSNANYPTENTGTSKGVVLEAIVEKLTIRDTAWLSLEFSMLWFVANYFTAACLNYTSVASSTILTATSSIWTLLIGATLGVEAFTLRKLIGVLASFAGIVLTSSVDISGDNEENRGSFPYKSPRQISIGDALALLSAILYGVYTTVMKKKVGDEARVNMPLFFGFVGLFNIILLVPGFPILHYAGVEAFELPPTRRVWTIILINSGASLVADFCWAYAMLLTSPLVVTVGLSLTIPLSLIGQMILNGQTSSALYWVGAGIVFLSFLFINYESKQQG